MGKSLIQQLAKKAKAAEDRRESSPAPSPVITDATIPPRIARPAALARHNESEREDREEIRPQRSLADLLADQFSSNPFWLRLAAKYNPQSESSARLLQRAEDIENGVYDEDEGDYIEDEDAEEMTPAPLNHAPASDAWVSPQQQAMMQTNFPPNTPYTYHCRCGQWHPNTHICPEVFKPLRQTRAGSI